MTTRGTADVVFCLDASLSMAPCLEGVKTHIGAFIAGLGTRQAWDLRFELVAYRARQMSSDEDGRFYAAWTGGDDLIGALYGGQARLLEAGETRVKEALTRVRPFNDEATLVALDCCLDLPWRLAANCHRVIVAMTDEPLESGMLASAQAARLPELIDKIQRTGVSLFLVAPDSPGYDQLSGAQRSEYYVVAGGDGLVSVDFKDVLSQIGKSVSVSRAQAPPLPSDRRALYGQHRWAPAERDEAGPWRAWAGTSE